MEQHGLKKFPIPDRHSHKRFLTINVTTSEVREVWEPEFKPKVFGSDALTNPEYTQLPIYSQVLSALRLW